MKTYKKRGLTLILSAVILCVIPACNNVENDPLQNAEDVTTEEIKLENQPENEISPDDDAEFNSSITITENIDTLNSILETDIGQSFSLLTTEEYEKTGQSDWALILQNDRVGIDLAAWKHDYEPDSEDNRYMDAILIIFNFFYGDEMGNSLWLLTDDLLDGGADEKSYGFIHDGGQVIYKNGRSAVYEANSSDSFYLWLIPEDQE